MPRTHTHTQTLPSLLEAHILTYTLTLIAALLALLMLLWHISSTHLVNDYGMPEDWAREFLKMQFGGGKGGMWGVLFVLIPLDCIHALLALDWYHGCRFERGTTHMDTTPDTMRGQISKNRTHTTNRASPSSLPTTGIARKQISTASSHIQQSTASTKSIIIPPLPSSPPQTHHPLFSPLLPPLTRLLLQTLYDITLILLLALHIFDFFASFPANMDACDYPHQHTYPSFVTDRLQTNLTVRERCVRINIDIHVSGGFDVGVCAVLMGLHCVCAGGRVWEWVAFRGGVSDGMGMVDKRNEPFYEDENEMDMGDGGETGERACNDVRDHRNACFMGQPPLNSTTKYPIGHAMIKSLDEEQRTGMDMCIRHRNWSNERQTRSKSRGRRASWSSDAESLGEVVESLSEVLLECLVP